MKEPYIYLAGIPVFDETPGEQPPLPFEFSESLDGQAECDCRCGQTAHPMDMYLDPYLHKLFMTETHREEYVDEVIERLQNGRP